ncbi:MAG: hypothetical protein U9O89_00905 [Thermoproteota archaeon]|nr:hypothetical protein [Thermoproteota archaeon]
MNNAIIDIEKAVYGQLGHEEFTVRVAATLEEDQELIDTGFECATERDEIRYTANESKCHPDLTG